MTTLPYPGPVKTLSRPPRASVRVARGWSWAASRKYRHFHELFPEPVQNFVTGFRTFLDPRKETER